MLIIHWQRALTSIVIQRKRKIFFYFLQNPPLQATFQKILVPTKNIPLPTSLGRPVLTAQRFLPDQTDLAAAEKTKQNKKTKQKQPSKCQIRRRHNEIRIGLSFSCRGQRPLIASFQNAPRDGSLCCYLATGCKEDTGLARRMRGHLRDNTTVLPHELSRSEKNNTDPRTRLNTNQYLKLLHGNLMISVLLNAERVLGNLDFYTKDW